MISVVAIDDEPLALNVIKNYCSRLDFLELKETFTDANKALAYLNEHPVDLVFLDIHMPSISGIELCQRISDSSMVIFTTAHSQYAVDGFDLSAIDYLLKPFAFERFEKSVEKAKEYYEHVILKRDDNQQCIYVRADYAMVRVVLADIKYIEGVDNYIKIHYDNGKHLLVRMSMKVIMERLPEREFVRIHRSYIVPVRKITVAKTKTVTVEDIGLPIGAIYSDDLLRILQQ